MQKKTLLLSYNDNYSSIVQPSIISLELLFYLYGS